MPGSAPLRRRAGLLALLLAAASAAAGDEPRARMVDLPAGESLKVTTLGAGPPVVLIPGLFGSAYGYRKLLPRLADDGWQAVVIEPLGVGESARPASADYSLTAQADRVAAAMQALQIERAVIVAHAIGASMAFRLAVRHPQRVAALVSLEGGAAESAATGSFRRAMKLAPLLKLLGTGFVRGKIRGQLEQRSADPGWVTDEVVDGYTRGPAADLGGTLAAFRRMGNAREPEPLAPQLSQVRCPVRLLLGAAPHAGGPTPADVEGLRRSLPSLEVERVPGAGHFVFEEAPGAVVDAVRRAANDETRRRGEAAR